MKIRKKNVLLLALMAFMTASHDARAHTTVVPKTTPDNYYVREEPDGAKSVVNTFSIPHDCNGENVIASSVLFPNGSHIVVEDEDGNRVDEEILFNELKPNNNLIMMPKPAIDANWKFQDVAKSPTRQFYSHGLRTEDSRAFYYSGGNLPGDFIALLPWRASFADIKEGSCVKAIKVRTPIVNYCQQRPNSAARMDAWIGRTTEVFNDPEVVSVGWWPTITIVNTSFDADVCGEGTVYSVSPTDEDIDELLPIKSFKP